MKKLLYIHLIYFNKPFNSIEFNTNDLFLITFKSNSEKHSYILNDNSVILDVAEKNAISPTAIAGLYGFKNFDIFNKLLNQTNNLDYISQLFNIAKDENLTVQTREADIVYCFDTLNEYEFYRYRIFGNYLKIGLGCDHSGLLVKNKLKIILDEMKIEYNDYGTYSNEPCDYYEFVLKLKNDYDANIIDIGIGSCRSGQGVNICANHLGFLSTFIYNNKCVKLTREHNCSNFFVIPECLLDNIDLKEFINDICSSNFQGGRHYDRLNQVLEYNK
jgi:ribose 5-phosphate isomerase B